MINKKKALYLLQEYGDAVIDFSDRHKASIVVTTDFNNKYIKSIKRTKRFTLKGNILLFDWTNNEFIAVSTREIRTISPLATILGNQRDAEVEKIFRKTKTKLQIVPS